MGQYSLLMMIATLVGGTLIMAQSNTTTIASNEKHAGRQEEMLAREIARSAYNMMLTEARDYERAHPNATIQDVVTAINGGSASGWKTGSLHGGDYTARLEAASLSSFAVVSNGTFGEAAHHVEENHLREKTLLAPDSSTATTTVIESQPSACAAVYVQRMIPKNNNGHGNNTDGVDSSNPGGSKTGQDSDPTTDDEKVKGNLNSRYRVLEPELLMASGSSRNGLSAPLSTNISSGERLNFYLAVDQNCDAAGRTDLPLTSNLYDYYLPALTNPAGSFEEIEESKYVLIEQNATSPNKWRLAFETDTKFSDDKYADVKLNGYGDASWKKRSGGQRSYGGSGWSLRDAWGYYDLLTLPGMPDFSDQVFEIVMVSVP